LHDIVLSIFRGTETC